MRTLLTAAVASLIVANSAYAADVWGSSAYNWSGVYAGVLLGYGTGSTEAEGDPGFDGSAPDDRAEISPQGIVGGGVAGINWQRGQLVYGLEGELGYLGAKDDIWYPDGDDYFAETEYGLYGSISGRLGYALDRTLLAARAGVIAADIDYGFGDIDNGDSPDDTASVIDGNVRAGLFVGASVEHAFSGNWIGRLDYAYSHFGSHTETDEDGDDYEISDDLHMIRIGLIRKF